MRPRILWDLCVADYFPLRPTIRSENTRRQYKIALASFGAQLGRDATLADLTDDALTRWLTWLLRLEPPLSVNTIRERIGRVQTLWSWLAKRGVLRKWPTVIKPPPVDPLPQALTEEQLRRLFASAAEERGKIGGVPADLWWRSFLGFVWNTGERKGAALCVRCEWLRLNEPTPSVSIPPGVRKGGRKWGVYVLWPELVPLLKTCLAATPPRELVWPWDRCEGSYYTSYNRILRDAEIPVSRKTKTHGLRVSHATWLKVAGGDPTAQLMHGDSATTQRHYLDPRLTQQPQPKLFVPW